MVWLAPALRAALRHDAKRCGGAEPHVLNVLLFDDAHHCFLHLGGGEHHGAGIANDLVGDVRVIFLCSAVRGRGRINDELVGIELPGEAFQVGLDPSRAGREVVGHEESGLHAAILPD